MKREGVKPTVITYSALISAAEKGQQWKLALEVLDEMKRNGLEPNVVGEWTRQSKTEQSNGCLLLFWWLL